jgi:FkbM family methyltransferase
MGAPATEIPMNRLKTLAVNGLNSILPVSIKNSLFHLSFHLARSEFDRFSYDVNFAPNMELGLIAAAGRGLQPQTILDVGAFEGNWSRMARRIWPRSRIVMFEANARKQPNLSTVAHEIGASLCCELLGADDGAEVVFNVMESGSSVLNERSPVERDVENRTLRRIDAIPLDLTGNILLKIDTQGYELEVLKGAGRLLPRVDAILLEVAIIEINEGAPLLHEVLVFLKSLGFVTYDILEIHRRPLDQAMNQVDILFVRDGSPLIADKRHYA